MQKQLPERRPDHVNLSASRTPDGVSLNAAAIPAISPSAIRRSDSGAEVIDPAAIAPPAQTSRRSFLMNTMVSAASLATAAAVAAPTIASAAPAGDVSFPDLVAEFVKIRERLNEQRANFKAWSGKLDQLFFDATGVTNDEGLAIDCSVDPRGKRLVEIRKRLMKENPYWGDDDAFDRIQSELWSVAEVMFSRQPMSVTDLAWQAEALVTADPDLFIDRKEALSERLHRQVFENIRTLAGPQPLLSDYPLISIPATRSTSLADAELLKLADEYIAAEQKCCDLEFKADEMKGPRVSSRPCPEVLRWRETDGELGLGCRGEWWDQYFDVGSLRVKEWETYSQIKNGDEITFSTRGSVPSDAARDRAHEIIAAFDEWDKDRKPPRGYKKAVREAESARREYRRIEVRIAKTRAATVQGMLAKVRCAHAYAKSDELNSIDSGGAEEVMALSIFDDIKLAAAVSPSITSTAPAGSVSLPLSVSDRTSAAIDRVRKAEKLFDRRWHQCDTAKNAAIEKHGYRPTELIAWRNYSHIGMEGIERCRKESLRDGVDASIIEHEYRDAKKRYRAIVKAGKDWDKVAGVDQMSKAVDEARAEMEAARRALGSVELKSVADASAIVGLIHTNIKKYNDGSLDPWEMAAFRNAGSFLGRWMRGQTRVAARRDGRRYSDVAI
jgi:hypothetical protein